jgi:hypothetical protein
VGTGALPHLFPASGLAVPEDAILLGDRYLHVAIAQPVTKGEGGPVHVLAGAAGGLQPGDPSPPYYLLGTDQGWIVPDPQGKGSYFLFGDTWLYFTGKNGGVVYEDNDLDNDCMGFIFGHPPIDQHTPPPDTQFILSSVTIDGVTVVIPAPVTITYGDGKTMVGLAQGGDLTPTAPFSTSKNLYSFFRFVQQDDQGNLITLGHVLGQWQPVAPEQPKPNLSANFVLPTEDSTDPLALRDPTNKFDYFQFMMSYAVPRVATGKLLVDLDPLDLPMGLPMVSPVFVWGRMWTGAIAKTDGTMVGGGLRSVRLMVFDADALDNGEAPQFWYLRTFDWQDRPVWTPFDAETVVQEGVNEPFAVVNEDKDHEPVVVGTGTVTYDPDLRLWLMLYGGHPGVVANVGDGTPDGFLSPAYTIGDQGVFLRVASTPWGLWSKRQRVWPTPSSSGWDFTNDGLAQAGTIYNFPGIQSSEYQERSRILFIPIKDELHIDPPASAEKAGLYENAPKGVESGKALLAGYAGFEYAPSIWHGAGMLLHPPSVEGVQIQKELYFGLSTWNPYHVVLMRTIITIDQPQPPYIPDYAR